MHCGWPGDYHSLGLTCIQFRSPKVTPLTDPAKVTGQGFCYCYSNACWWYNSHQHNRSAYFTEIKKGAKCTGGTITRRQFLQNVNQFTLMTILHNVLRQGHLQYWPGCSTLCGWLIYSFSSVIKIFLQYFSIEDTHFMNESFIKISRTCVKSQADQGLEL